MRFNMEYVLYRSTCDKQQSSQGSGGGIAVPVVKSSSSNSSWLNHLSTPSYDWHLSSAAADSYANHQRSLRTSSMDTYPSYDQSVASHPRAIVEAPKVGKDHIFGMGCSAPLYFTMHMEL